jgi:ABC-2 type transport system ATP-binding protein
MTAREPALRAQGISKSFLQPNGERIQALDGLSIDVQHAELTALVGPDGAGKTTLMRLAAGLMLADRGSLRVLGIDVREHPQAVQDAISYMPQRFGLYEDLSVAENLDLYADLHGVTPEQRAQRYPLLMEMTALSGFRGRLAGRLSGGMKQKLGLACTLVRSPALLLLDEPTVGVDPLSRRELWEIVQRLVSEQSLTVLVSTSYLDEAERCHRSIVLHRGQLLVQAVPAEVAQRAAGHVFRVDPAAGQPARVLQSQLLERPGTIDAVPEGGHVRYVRSDAADTDAADTSGSQLPAAQAVPPRFEDGFMMLLAGKVEREHASGIAVKAVHGRNGGRSAVRVDRLVKRFGKFIAVDQISFEVQAGEIFGLLGPNGAGKTTTFRMLCGLLTPSAGELYVADTDVRRAAASARARLGYVAQKFSLYGALSVTENLEFFASAYGLRGARQRARIDWAVAQFELGDKLNSTSAQLPGGYKQRLAMAAALLHEPEILFLDEPTSGADPLARRAFWARITSLAQQGVTVIVTTHFMEEAEYCDRVAIMDAGRILAQGSPAQVRQLGRGERAEPTMDDAFVAVVMQSRHEALRPAS